MTVIDIPYPTKCNECRCYNIAYGVCSIGFRKVDETKKPQWCPIKCDFDEIRAEIEKERVEIHTIAFKGEYNNLFDDGRHNGLLKALEIIDKYRGEQP